MTKKHILKPGKHQFAPGSPAIHDNDNLTDEEAEWYMDKYPHIKSLFLPAGQPNEPEQKEAAFPLKVGAIINKPSVESTNTIGVIPTNKSVESSQKIDEIHNPGSVESPTKISVIPTKNEDLFATN